MKSSILVSEKKEFIKWFLKHNKLKKIDGVWILNFLLSNEQKLEKVHFVEEAHYCPNAIIMTAEGVNGIPFLYQKGYEITTSGQKAFNDLLFYKDRELYIQINFLKRLKKEYVLVLEENQYLPKEEKSNEEDRKIAEEFLNHSLYLYQLSELEKEIDEALDKKDKKIFLDLSNKWLLIKEKISDK